MHCGLDRAISGATQCLFLSGLMRAHRGRELTCSRPLYSILLSLSPFTPWGVVYRRAIYFLRFANGFPRLGFVFLPIYSLYRIFISRVKIAKGNVKEGTGSCPKDPAGYGKNGYFVVLHRVHRVGGCICWFCDGFVIWLPWWLIDVSHSFSSYRRIFTSIFALFCFLFFFFFQFLFRKRVLSARGCVRVCLQGVNCGKVTLTDLQYWMIFLKHVSNI